MRRSNAQALLCYARGGHEHKRHKSVTKKAQKTKWNYERRPKNGGSSAEAARKKDEKRARETKPTDDHIGMTRAIPRGVYSITPQQATMRTRCVHRTLSHDQKSGSQIECTTMSHSQEEPWRCLGQDMRSPTSICDARAYISRASRAGIEVTSALCPELPTRVVQTTAKETHRRARSKRIFQQVS